VGLTLPVGLLSRRSDRSRRPRGTRRARSASSTFGLTRRVGIAAEKFVGVVSMVDRSGTAAIRPAKSPAVGDPGVPFAPARHAVVTPASEKQLVRIRPTTLCPVRCMVDFAVIARFEAIGTGAAAVAGKKV
jgi:hypothetical protein